MKDDKNMQYFSKRFGNPSLSSAVSSSNSDSHINLTARLIAWLLLLRIPFYYGMFLVVSILRPLRGFGSGIYLVATSVLLAILIWQERDHLQNYNIDSWTVGMFLVGKPIEFIIILSGVEMKPASTIPLYAVYIAVAIGLGWALRSRWTQLPKPNHFLLKWILLGIVLGIGFGALGGFAILAQIPISLIGASVARALTPSRALSLILFQAASAGISEELLFRGFLWGYLRKLGWLENRILFFPSSFVWDCPL